MAKMQPVARIVIRKLKLIEQLLFGSNPGISTVASVSRCRSQCQEGKVTSLNIPARAASTDIGGRPRPAGGCTTGGSGALAFCVTV